MMSDDERVFTRGSLQSRNWDVIPLAYLIFTLDCLNVIHFDNINHKWTFIYYKARVFSKLGKYSNSDPKSIGGDTI